MQLIDAQIHAVLPVAELDAGLTHDQAVAVSAELAVASMDAVGVTAAVVSDQLAQVRGYLANHPDRFAGVPYMAWPELESDFPVAECLAELGATPGMVGIRLIIATESRAEILQTGGYEPYLVA